MNYTVFHSGALAPDEIEFEVVERKGNGHPDTLCDRIAERISAAFSQYAEEHHGVVLRHMLDKISLRGGSAHVEFGGGHMIAPATVYLNCRFTREVEGQQVPYLEIAHEQIHRTFNQFIPHFDVEQWLEIVDNTHLAPGPGVVHNTGKASNEREHFFTAPDKAFLEHHSNHGRANDTSTAVAYAPLSVLETAVGDVERILNKLCDPCIGTDVKVMGVRNKQDIELTCCIPLISEYIENYEAYKEKLEFLEARLKQVLSERYGRYNFTVFVNTRDRMSDSDLYLTLTGSAVESGDEGVVGRGNRVRGVIPFTRHMSMEAAAGKNPMYHVGKVYTALAFEISNALFLRTRIPTNVYVTSQIGRPLDDPWQIGVDAHSAENAKYLREHSDIVDLVLKESIKKLPELRQQIWDEKIELF